MTLPIIDSILHGELRPNILPTLKTEKEISLIWRDLHKVVVMRGCEFRTLERILTDALDKNGLVKLVETYSNDRDLRTMAQESRRKGMVIGNPVYTPVNAAVNLSDLYVTRSHTTPSDRFYTDLLMLESMRTKQALAYLALSVQDDSYMRTELRKLFQKITNLCKHTDNDEIREALTVLYFEVLHTYNPILQRGESANYETDFENFVFEWKGEFPEKDIVEKYKQLIITKVDLASVIVLPKEEVAQLAPTSNKHTRAKDKADIFLEKVAEYNFLELPKIRMLASPEKIHKLVLTMLENPGHACAMLEYLGFYQWIKDTQRAKFTKGDYDTLCSNVVMNMEKSQAFHTVRMSLNGNNQNAEKYKAYSYIKQVEDEYGRLLNE